MLEQLLLTCFKPANFETSILGLNLIKNAKSFPCYYPAQFSFENKNSLIATRKFESSERKEGGHQPEIFEIKKTTVTSKKHFLRGKKRTLRIVERK